jgi:glycosyltransferase involved in cell wall biosynthesis
MVEWMRLSFVVPTRNQAPFIRTCLDACLSQRVQDAEVVVVDGLSDDGTRAILESYGQRVRWVSERDSGQSEALNKGVRMARGEVIAWVNSDDYYPEAMVLPRVLEIFDADPRVDVVYGDGQLVDVNHRPIRPLPAREPLSARAILLFAGAVVSQPSVFFRRSLFLELGGVDEQLHWCMDYELWIRLFARARRVARAPGLLSCTTSHDAAKTVHGMLHQIAEVGLVKRRHAPAFALGPLERLRLHGAWASMYVYWAATRLGLLRAS